MLTRMMPAIGAFAATAMLLTLFVPLTLVKNHHLPAHYSHGKCGDLEKSSRTEQSLLSCNISGTVLLHMWGATIQKLSMSSG